MRTLLIRMPRRRLRLHLLRVLRLHNRTHKLRQRVLRRRLMMHMLRQPHLHPPLRKLTHRRQMRTLRQWHRLHRRCRLMRPMKVASV